MCKQIIKTLPLIESCHLSIPSYPAFSPNLKKKVDSRQLKKNIGKEGNKRKREREADGYINS
jgi:hypothetical protein